MADGLTQQQMESMGCRLERRPDGRYVVVAPRHGRLAGDSSTEAGAWRYAAQYLGSPGVGRGLTVAEAISASEYLDGRGPGED